MIFKDTIKHHFSKQSDKDTKQSKESFIKSLTENGGNTHYKMECKKCGYNKKVMIGGGHTSDLKGYFSTELVYCPTCREPLDGGFVHYRNKSDGENKTYNKRCPKCGEKTKTYDVNQKDIKLKCPKCGSNNLEITNMHEFWMT